MVPLNLRAGSVRDIPKEFWTPESLSVIASTVGHPIKLDKLTETKKQREFRRACVEEDAKSELPDKVSVLIDEDYTIQVKFEYNWVPVKCKNCLVFGHIINTCSMVDLSITHKDIKHQE
ncbi:hypothetical protein GIB67_005122 [Kingdonia uniflora]|uniref:DUF4283 domain-containing protein n=1 Tax=Kingdonia uniflora TaxID=39325 RepID=A0A7J7ND79_9MAGN|nr:hypothetical protein GIB67_005122 [Kingdonia uniflora]